MGLESATEEIDLAEMFAGKSTFVLRLRGDSMIDDHLCDGDYVVIDRRHDTALEGEQIVALLDTGEATLKRAHFTDADGKTCPSAKATKIRLAPANAKYEAKTYDRDRCRIQGVVIGVLRSYHC